MALSTAIAVNRSARYRSEAHHAAFIAIVRLKAALISGGLISGDPAYERLIDAELSRVA